MSKNLWECSCATTMPHDGTDLVWKGLILPELSAPDRAIEVAIAIAVGITKPLIAQSAVISKWSSLGQSDSDLKSRNQWARANDNRTPENSSFCRKSGNIKVSGIGCDRWSLEICARHSRRVPPCAVKTCAVRPVFARAVGELRAADPSNVQGPVKQNASPKQQFEAPRPRWKLGQEQRPGPENQDSQHMLKQPRGSFPVSQVVR